MLVQDVARSFDLVLGHSFIVLVGLPRSEAKKQSRNPTAAARTVCNSLIDCRCAVSIANARPLPLEQATLRLKKQWRESCQPDPGTPLRSARCIAQADVEPI